MHHLLTYLIQDVADSEKLVGQDDVRQQQTETFLNEYAVGKNGDILPEGTGKLMKAGSKVRFNIHYHSNGKETVDRSRVAVKFYPKGYVPKYHQISLQIASANSQLDLPAGAVSRNEGYYRFDKPVQITAIQAHMHNIGKRMCLEAILPTNTTHATQLHGMGFQLAQGLQLRRRGQSAAAGGHGAARNLVARQHEGEPGEPGSAQLARLRAAHHRRDGFRVDHVVEPRRGRLQSEGRRANEAPRHELRADEHATHSPRERSMRCFAGSVLLRPSHARPGNRDERAEIQLRAERPAGVRRLDAQPRRLAQHVVRLPEPQLGRDAGHSRRRRTTGSAQEAKISASRRISFRAGKPSCSR